MRVAFDLFQANGLPASRVQGSVVSSDDSPRFRQVCMYVCMYMYVCVRARACVNACVRACVRVCMVRNDDRARFKQVYETLSY
jgi:hypothetical protein